jgi:predicted nucleotidyltransferase
MIVKNITSYEDINELLSFFLEHINNVLKENFIGMYLYGSLATGDFDVNSSDIDFIVLTKNSVAEKEFLLLSRMHNEFRQRATKWAEKIEAAYVDKMAFQALNNNENLYPQIEKDGGLAYNKLEIGWAFQAYTLREYGVIVSGPKPKEIIAPIAIEDMLNAARAITGLWIEQSQDNKESQFIRDENRFVVFTLCRFLYLFKTKQIASKKEAAEWAIGVEKKWASLISTIGNLQIADALLKEDVHFKYTVDFIHYTNAVLCGEA